MTDNTEEAKVAATETQAETGKKKQKPAKKHGAVYNALDKFFGFTDRGTNIKTEIFAGILLFVEMAFFLYVNAMMLSNTINDGINGGNLVPVNSLYFIMTMVSCVTTVAIGVFCNAPFVQAGSLGITMLIVSIAGEYAGLTYANIMAISLVANLVYLVVMVIKPVRQFIFNAVPDSIRKALPAAMGIFLIVYVLVQMNVLTITSYDFSDVFLAVQNTGAAQLGFFGISFVGLSLDSMTADTFFNVAPFVVGLIAFIILLVLKRFKVKHATIISFGGTFVIYLILYYFVRLNAVGLADYDFFSFITKYSYGEKIYYSTSNVMNYANMKYLWIAFKEGFDFTAYTEAGGTGVAGIFIASVVSFLILGVSETGTAVNACGYITGSLDEKGQAMYISQPLYKKAADYVNVYSVNALCSVLGCALGAGPVVVRAENTVGAHEGGKTGLTAIVAGILLIIPMFTLTFAAVFCNGNVIYGIMVFVGFVLLTSLKNCDFSSVISIIPFMLTVLLTAFTLNLATALTIGIIADTLIKALTFKFKQISVGNWVLFGVMVIILVLQLCL